MGSIFGGGGSPAPIIIPPAPEPQRVEGSTDEERKAGLEAAAKRRLRLAQSSGTRQFRIDLNSPAAGSGISIPGRSSARA